MKDVVAITTDDLETAVRLRGGFAAVGLDVELLATHEDLDDVVGNPILLLLTGDVRGARAVRLIADADVRGRLPVIGLFEPGTRPARDVCRGLGLAECFEKPVDLDEVVLVCRRTLERGRLREITGIVGRTEVMEEVLERVVQIAGVDSTVLIQGESGTGKELVARGLHALSPRRHRPFIAANVAALPETLLESELFGHEKGAFTGAASLRKGLFELAQGGTVFLDEIGEMPPSTQTKLLRVLEEREFRRVGGEEILRVDVRVVTATNRDLREQVEIGEFRRDLYHRLNVLRIILPSLRERPEDIPRLIAEFVREFSAQHDRPFHGISAEALDLLVSYPWPGNVRELRNLVESMVVLAPGHEIGAEDIPRAIRDSGGRRLLPVPVGPIVREGERAQGRELEFIVRSLVELKLQVEELRRRMDSEVRAPGVGGIGWMGEVHAVPGLGVPSGDVWVGQGINGGIPPQDQPAPPSIIEVGPDTTMAEIERRAIEAMLRQTGGNRRKAADLLGIGERTLYRKLREYQAAGLMPDLDVT